MTPGERILDILATVPPPGSTLDWFADRLLAVATETPSVMIRLVPALDSTPPSWHVQVEESGRTLDGGKTAGVRVFRPLLARLAVIAAEETGTEFQPYGGRYYLFRTGPNGPVRLDVEFSNTTVSQRLSFTRKPATEPQNGQPANGSVTPLIPAAPAGA